MGLFPRTIPVSTDAEKIRELLTRGVERVYPSKEALETKLKIGKPLLLYYGIDPTGPTLHLGHLVNLLKLRAFQELGHEIIILYGGFTAQIGDPTDKLAARQPLSSKQIQKNADSYKKLIGKILDIRRANTRFLDNERWSNKLKPADMLGLAARFTVSQLLERDMFQERMKQGKEIYAHEFLYPIFQAYDAVIMDVDIQIGGNDQTFNMLAGRTLMRKIKNKEKFVISMKLLADPTGKKMGKTEGNMVTLADTPSDMFGKVMRWSDGMIFSGFELCTRVPLTDIEQMKKELETGVNPKELKLKLAEEIVSLLHGSAEAKRARAYFTETFSARSVPEDVAAVKATEHELLIDVSLKSPAQIISSKTEFRRLAAENAITHLESGEKVKDDTFPAKAGTYRFGKHRFLKVECM